MRISVSLFLVCLVVAAHAQPDGRIVLSGAGATFPAPLYEKWFEKYASLVNVRFNYEAVGSGEGIRRLKGGSVDFGATDAFLSDNELHDYPGAVLHIPTCVSAVAVVHNLGFQGQALRLTPDVLADIYRGGIGKWSDRRLRRLNSDLNLPKTPIHVIHRSDSSGTTFVFTDYLAKVSPDWAREVGSGKEVVWPVGIGVDQNANLANMVRRIPGSIGYVSLAYAIEAGLPYALIQNRSGQFVSPALDTVSAAADVELPPDCRRLITDTTAEKGYPISAFTYLIVYQNQAYGGRSEKTARALADFLWWLTHDGQAYNASLGYSVLPDVAVKRCESTIRRLRYGSLELRSEQ